MVLSKKRFDYFLIWGHGLCYKDRILELIRADEYLKIVKIVKHCPRNIKSFVKKVYSFDYAPFEHLRAKTAYLMTTPRVVLVIFVQNMDVQEVVKGRAAFRHVECERIRAVKDAIRDACNPRENGKRSEDHVIHASDNEMQTDHMLRCLGYKGGIETLLRKPNQLLELPYHIPAFHSFKIKSIPISKLDCNVLVPKGDNPTAHGFLTRRCRICESPHYACLIGDIERFRAYITRAAGILLCDDHSSENFLALSKRLRYLAQPHSSSYILTHYSPDIDRYIVLDGLHRASILAFRGVQKIVVAVVQ